MSCPCTNPTACNCEIQEPDDYQECLDADVPPQLCAAFDRLASTVKRLGVPLSDAKRVGEKLIRRWLDAREGIETLEDGSKGMKCEPICGIFGCSEVCINADLPKSKALKPSRGMPASQQKSEAAYQAANHVEYLTGEGQRFTVVGFWPTGLRFKYRDQWRLIQSGAFDHSLRSYPTRLVLNHDVREIVGDTECYRNLEVRSQPDGLYFKADLFDGNEIHALTIDRLISGKYSGLSLGYLENKVTQFGGMYVCSSAKLQELSLVEHGANPFATVMLCGHRPPRWMLDAMTASRTEADMVLAGSIQKLMRFRDAVAA